MSPVKKKINIAIFVNDHGQVTRVPSPNRTRIPVLAYLASKFEPNRVYHEKEVNAVLNRWHSFADYFLLRRLLVDYGFLARTADGSEYRVVNSGQECFKLDKNRKTAPVHINYN
jgi:hypothetical protein